jgi:homospermidine synthase
MDEKKHALFRGRLLFVGFGSIGQGTLPLILRHIDMPRERITILTADERGRKEAEEYGIKFVVNPIKRDNVQQVLGPLLGKGDFLLNLSVDVSSTVLIEYCLQNGVFYLDTCIEPWHGMYTDGSLPLAKRSNYGIA